MVEILYRHNNNGMPTRSEVSSERISMQLQRTLLLCLSAVLFSSGCGGGDASDAVDARKKPVLRGVAADGPVSNATRPSVAELGPSTVAPVADVEPAAEPSPVAHKNTPTARTGDSTPSKKTEGKIKTRSATRVTEKPVVLFLDPKLYPDGTKFSKWAVHEYLYGTRKIRPNNFKSLTSTRDPVESDNPAVQFFKAYWSITAWEQRLPMVLKPKAARPLMQEKYKNADFSDKNKVQTDLHTIRGPATELRVGESAIYALSWRATDKFVNAEIHATEAYRLHKTADGLRLDWIGMVKHMRGRAGDLPWGKIANDDSIPEVTFKKLDIVGERYRRKRVKVVGCRFKKLSTIYLDSLPSVRVSTDGLLTTIKTAEYEKWFGMWLEDKEGESYFKIFAMKAAWVDTFLEMKGDQLLNISGRVVELKNVNGYGIVVTEVEILDPAKY